MMNQKGVKIGVLEYVVLFIVGIFGIIVAFFMLLRTGTFATFQSQLYGIVCTASVYGRGIIISMILSVWAMMAIIIDVMLAISSFRSAGAGETASSWLVKIIQSAKVIGSSSVFALAGILSLTILLTYFFILPAVGGIPLFCPSVTIDVGAAQQPATSEKVLNEISADTVDCWNMYGAGKFDPLIGLDPPNPKECRILQVYSSGTLNLKTDIYDYMYSQYGKSWPLGTRLYAYGTVCGKMGNNPNNWAGCNFNNAIIYIMYRDRHVYDLGSYGTAVCNGIISSEDFGDTGDAIVWCIENIS